MNDLIRLGKAVRRYKSMSISLLGLVLSLWFAQPAAGADKPDLLVYAAASLTNVLEELGGNYHTATGQNVKFSFASSSVLAKQVAAGAAPDVFFSADTQWVEYLNGLNLLKSETRIDLLGNRLVLIAPVDSKATLYIAPGFALSSALGKQRLAIGDPDSVPAGRYARTALTSLGVWNSVVDKLVLADSVRTALAFVSRGETPFGIVYSTDALIDKRVRIVDTFPDDSHPAIVYPLALTITAKPGAADFVAFLSTTQSRAVFEKYGFTVLAHSDK